MSFTLFGMPLSASDQRAVDALADAMGGYLGARAAAGQGTSWEQGHIKAFGLWVAGNLASAERIARDLAQRAGYAGWVRDFDTERALARR